MISPTAFATLLDDLIRDADLKGVVETATTDLRPNPSLAGAAAGICRMHPKRREVMR